MAISNKLRHSAIHHVATSNELRREDMHHHVATSNELRLFAMNVSNDMVYVCVQAGSRL